MHGIQKLCMTSKINVGTDIEEIQRFRKKPIGKNRTFYQSLFTKLELSHCLKYSDPYTHLAGIFAAKEAIVKCLGKPTGMKNIEIFWDDNGKPKVIINSRKLDNIDISISHTRSIALAVAVILL